MMPDEGEDTLVAAVAVGFGAPMMPDEGEDTLVATVAVGFGLPEELAAMLPTDPFEQLYWARKNTSIALASRAGWLEADAAGMDAQLVQRDAAVDLHEHVEQLDSTLALTTDRPSRAEDEKLQALASQLSSSIGSFSQTRTCSIQGIGVH